MASRKKAVDGVAKEKAPPKSSLEKLHQLRERIAKLEREARLEESGAPPEIVKLVKRHAFLVDQAEAVAEKLRDTGYATDGTKLL